MLIIKLHNGKDHRSYDTIKKLLVHVKRLLAYVPDIAGVRIPSPITMEAPTRTNTNIRRFKNDVFSKVSFIFKALSSSGVGSLSLKLDIYSSAC